MSIRRVKFTKMSGAGNDFVVIDNRDQVLESDASDFARVVSERRRGVGADGVILLEESTTADFLMNYYNADGSYGGFCGNGGRCIARYAHMNKIAPAQLTFESLGHIYSAEVLEGRVRLKMKDSRNERLNVTLERNGESLRMHSVDTGAPHVVLFLDENAQIGMNELSTLDLVRIGRSIRNHSYFGDAGTNVNLVKLNENHSLSIRTYERGVEDETLACGTGSVASGLLASRVKGLKSPVKVIPKSGEPLVVEFENQGDHFRDVYLEGNAEIVFEGELKFDVLRKKIVE